MAESAVKARTHARAHLNLQVGGACALTGAIIFAVARTSHGDPPAADPGATLDYLATRSLHPAVHGLAVFGALIGLFGLLGLASSLSNDAAWLLGRAGAASALVGLAVFSVESTSEGLGLSVLARGAGSDTAAERADLIRTTRAITEATHGPSLLEMALMVGLPLVLLGLAMVVDPYPSWLGWAGTCIGAATGAW